MPPPRCGCEGRASTTLLHSNGTVGVVIIASSVVWRAAADRPCRARSAETALNLRRRTTGGSRATLRRRAANERGWVDVLPRTGTPTRSPIPRLRLHLFIRQIVPHLTRSRPPNGTGNTRSGVRIRRTPVIHLRLRLDARTATGGALNGQRPNAVNRATLPAAPNGWNARGNAHPCPRRAGGISIYTLQLSFLGH